MALTKVADHLFAVERMMGFPGAVKLPVRMTVVRLSDGGLVCCSLVEPDDALAAEVAALGPVRALVGPSLFHHLFLGPWQERFPDAKLFGAPGLAEKRPRLAFEAALGDQAPEAWRGELDTIAIAGAPRIREVAMLHRPSATLIVADLLFHILEPANVPTAMLLAVMGTRRRFAKSRIWWTLRKDRAAWAESVERVAAWPFRRVLVGHGAVFEADDAPARVRRVLLG